MTQMVQYQVLSKYLMKNKDSPMVLGRSMYLILVVTGNLGFRDHRDAFTNTTLIDTTSVSIEDGYSLKGLESIKESNISYRMVQLIKG